MLCVVVIFSLLVNICYCSDPDNLFNLVARDVTFSQPPPFHQVSVAHEEMCFSYCQHGTSQQCASFVVKTIKSSRYTCSFFNITYNDIYQSKSPGIIPTHDTLLYSKSFKRDCTDWYNAGARKSGTYTIYIIGKRYPINVICSMSKKGWLTIQRRQSDDTTLSFFTRSWDEYKEGFGNINSDNFWIGNEKLYLLTNSKRYQLRIMTMDEGRKITYYYYNSITITSEEDGYRLKLGEAAGITDILREFHNRPFATTDRNEKSTQRCLSVYGGWWHAEQTCAISDVLNMKMWIQPFQE